MNVIFGLLIVFLILCWAARAMWRGGAHYALLAAPFTPKPFNGRAFCLLVVVLFLVWAIPVAVHRLTTRED